MLIGLFQALHYLYIYNIRPKSLKNVLIEKELIMAKIYAKNLIRRISKTSFIYASNVS